MTHKKTTYCYEPNKESYKKMLMPKKNRVAIYKYLFKEGIMIAKKNYQAIKYFELETISNLEVIKAVQNKLSLYISSKPEVISQRNVHGDLLLGLRFQNPDQEVRLQGRQKMMLVIDED
ncbi:40S ribosomal protein S10-like [Vespula maculifrons]|uniref:40S ribosomal protein S10-like n=1 Tax=Vespula maculifrons TaxID=7453 RepID=A0ABD2CVY7_VESMC